MSAPKSLGNGTQPAEELLARTLLGVAAILLRLGLSAPHAEHLLRRAFVSAARSNVRAFGLRATQSQIASLAGLSRLEVRKFLTSRARDSGLTQLRSTRVDQVLEGWRRDPLFLDARGRPRALETKGAHSAFAKLVSKYGRDVTAKTLRDQLLRAGAAVEKRGHIRIAPTHERRSREQNAAKSDLTFLGSQLKGLDLQLGRRAYITRRMTVRVGDKKSAQRLRRTALEKVQLTLSALEAMSAPATAITLQNRRSEHRVIITATIATESGEKTHD